MLRGWVTEPERSRSRPGSRSLARKTWNPDGIFGYHGVTQYRSAQIAARLGDHDRAINLLQQAVTAGFYNYLLIHRDANFESLRDDPEFQEILRPKG